MQINQESNETQDVPIGVGDQPAEQPEMEETPLQKRRIPTRLRLFFVLFLIGLAGVGTWLFVLGGGTEVDHKIEGDVVASALPAEYQVRDNRMYYRGARMRGVDLQTFVYLGRGPDGDYSKDKDAFYVNHLHSIDLLQPGFDATGIEHIESFFFKDAQYVYIKRKGLDRKEGFRGFRNIESSSAGFVGCASFEDVEHCFLTDENKVYVYNSKAVTLRALDDFDPQNFELLVGVNEDDDGFQGGRYFSSAQSVYFYSYDVKNDIYDFVEIIGADLDTFVDIDNEYAVDSSAVYLRGVVVQGAEPASFSIMQNSYSKDVKNVYFDHQIIPDADPESFQLLQDGYFMDAAHVYKDGQLVPDLEPTSCFFSSTDTCEKYVLDIEWESVLSKERIGDTYWIKYYAGTVQNGFLKGNPVYVKEASGDGMMCGGWDGLSKIERYVEWKGGDLSINVTEWQIEGFRGYDDLPDEFIYPETNYRFRKVYSDYFFISSTTKKILFSDENIGTVFLAGKIERPGVSEYSNVYMETSDHIMVYYRIIPPIYDQELGEFSVNINYASSSEVGTQNYARAGYVFSDEFDTDVVLLGSTPAGEEIYIPASSEDERLLDLYERYSSYWDGEDYYSYDQYPPYYTKDDNPDEVEPIYDRKFTYEEYVDKNPIIFWKDNLDRWFIFHDSEIEDMAYGYGGGKCKPVIYMYPEEVGEFHVSVDPVGDFIFTDPDYGEDGWDVRAYPDGTLMELETLEEYPYLFWESEPVELEEINEGWIVQKDGLEEFLNEKLDILGLNQNEIADFNEFWVARLSMVPSEQFKIQFVDQEEFDKFAPLTISGADEPDTVIRVIMHAAPAQPDDILPEQILNPTPSRDGFVVVEWGGSILSKE